MSCLCALFCCCCCIDPVDGIDFSSAASSDEYERPVDDDEGFKDAALGFADNGERAPISTPANGISKVNPSSSSNTFITVRFDDGFIDDLVVFVVVVFVGILRPSSPPSDDCESVRSFFDRISIFTK